MKAVVYEAYGGPEVLEIRDVAAPEPGPGELLIRVHATTVSTAEMAMRSGTPFFARFVSGLRRPRRATIPGSELAGEVVAIGAGVTRFAVGDRVVASTGAGLGASAELVTIAEDGALAPVPAAVPFEDAATVCEGGLTAMPFLRDAGRLTAGERVLINGASGAVGTAAVQLAKAAGAHVTGVCRGSHAELVRSLGADEIVDYRTSDFTKSAATYDVVFDVVGRSSFGRCERVLRPGGRYLRTVPSLGVIARMLWTSRIGSKRAVLMFTGIRKPAAKAKDLRELMRMLEAGTVRPVIGKRFGLDGSVEAHRFVETGDKFGSVVVSIPGG